MFKRQKFQTIRGLRASTAALAIMIVAACDQNTDIVANSPQEQNLSELQFVEKAVGKVVPSDNAYSLHQKGGDIVFVSVREMAEWDEYHIPGAISIPHSLLKDGDEFSWKLLENLSQTHDHVLVYCGAGHRSGFLASEARSRGLDNVFNLDGISFWKEKYPVSHGEKRAPDKEPKLIHLDEAYYYFESGYDDVDFIDVREPESIAMAGGKIVKGSKVIPLSDLIKNLDEIDCKKDTVLFCEGTFDGGECSASPAAGKIIIDRLGCKAGHIKYMIEGFGAWEAAGYPVESYSSEE